MLWNEVPTASADHFCDPATAVAPMWVNIRISVLVSLGNEAVVVLRYTHGCL